MVYFWRLRRDDSHGAYGIWHSRASCLGRSWGSRVVWLCGSCHCLIRWLMRCGRLERFTACEGLRRQVIGSDGNGRSKRRAVGRRSHAAGCHLCSFIWTLCLCTDILVHFLWLRRHCPTGIARTAWRPHGLRAVTRPHRECRGPARRRGHVESTDMTTKR